MAKLYFRYGAMGSSKTANAIMVQYNYAERGQRALMLKPRLDDRDGARYVGSRSGLRAPCRFVEELGDIDVTRYDCLIVDEAQFLTKAQVQALVDIVDRKGIPVICYGLRADFQGNLFEGSTWLMAWADTIEEIKTVCWCGRKATFNARMAGGRVVKAGEQIMIGGNESYVALCRRHWADGQLAPVEVRRIHAGKEAYMPLLRLADPSDDMIARYLPDGELYALTVDGQTASVAVLRQTEADVIELMNLATDPARRGQGYATRLVEHLLNLCRTRARHIEVGTDPSTVPFYERFGFRPDHVRRDFFTDNYHPPIVEDGVTLKDMVVLRMDVE